ncbi:MAG TPA: UpxY family transcription antiterminator [Chitinophagaceae bacterium]|jgi:transcription antitermination factor NusG
MARLAKQWYAVYTRPRWEKKVNELFTERGIESFCPLNKVHKQWSDRVKLVEEPLFKSYVFVHIPRDEQAEVRMVNGVLNFVYWLGKPAVIRQSEMDRIRRFLNQHENVSVESLDLKPNDNVVIRSGILMDKKAKVLRAFGNRVEVVIESLGYKLVAYVKKKDVEVMR